MSSFGTLKAADAETIKAWSRYRPFACGLCAHVFAEGDEWCMVMANTRDSPTRRGNFLVCGNCHAAADGQRLAMCEKRAALEREVERYQLLGLVDTPEQQRRDQIAVQRESRAAYDAGFSDGQYRGRDW